MKDVHADRMSICFFFSLRHCPWQFEGGYDPHENNCHLSFGPHVFLLKPSRANLREFDQLPTPPYLEVCIYLVI